MSHFLLYIYSPKTDNLNLNYTIIQIDTKKPEKTCVFYDFISRPQGRKVIKKTYNFLKFDILKISLFFVN